MLKEEASSCRASDEQISSERWQSSRSRICMQSVTSWNRKKKTVYIILVFEVDNIIDHELQKLTLAVSSTFPEICILHATTKIILNHFESSRLSHSVSCFIRSLTIAMTPTSAEWTGDCHDEWRNTLSGVWPDQCLKTASTAIQLKTRFCRLQNNRP